jgi:hypothetical protein
MKVRMEQTFKSEHINTGVTLLKKGLNSMRNSTKGYIFFTVRILPSCGMDIKQLINVA